MKASLIHIVLSVLLLVAYGSSRLLPCSGALDMDVTAAISEVISCDASGETNHDHQDGSHDHSDHQCVCPCHAPAVSYDQDARPVVKFQPHEFVPVTVALAESSLSPPDHIPIL